MSRTDAPPDAEAERAEPNHGAELSPEEITALFDRAEADAAAAEQKAADARALADRLRADRNVTPDGAPGRRPRWTRLAAVAALIATIVLLAAGGFMIKYQQEVRAHDRAQAEFAAAARQVVVTLMSIDFKNPQESVQRIIDNSVDPFRQEFQGAAEDFIKVSEDAKVITNATVNASAVQSMTTDTAVVMVAASSTVTNAEGAEEAPRNWRLMVDLKRDGDQIKMSKVEFVP
jgi:Mce-associated membrane protein